MARVTRPLKEIEYIHKKYPNDKTIYVEGITDKRIFDLFLSNFDRNKIRVYDIGYVDFPLGYACSVFKPDSNRHMVASLALRLEAAGVEDSSVLCITDSDLDFIVGKSIPDCALLEEGEHCSLEISVLTISAIRKFTATYGLCAPDEVGEFVRSLSECLKSVTVLHVLSHELVQNTGSGISKPEISTKLTFSGACFQLNETDYLKLAFQISGLTKQSSKLLKDAEKIKKRIPNDPRQYIRGHDLFEALLIRANHGISQALRLNEQSLWLLYCPIRYSGTKTGRRILSFSEA